MYMYYFSINRVTGVYNVLSSRDLNLKTYSVAYLKIGHEIRKLCYVLGLLVTGLFYINFHTIPVIISKSYSCHCILNKEYICIISKCYKRRQQQQTWVWKSRWVIFVFHSILMGIFAFDSSQWDLIFQWWEILFVVGFWWDFFFYLIRHIESFQ